MESTAFLKDFVDFVACDKKHTSILFYTFLAIAVIATSGMFLAIPAVNNDEIAMQAFGEGWAYALLCVCFLEYHFRPAKLREPIKLIEEIFFVSREHFKDDVGTWQEIDALHKRYLSSTIFTYKGIKRVLLCIFCGNVSRNILYTWFNVPVYTGELSESYSIVPYLYYVPPEFDQPIFLIYCYILHTSLSALSYLEGYVMVTILCLCITRVLVEFDTIYILIDHFCKEYKDFDFVDNSENFKRTYQLKADMARIVTCHQRIVRNHKTFADNSQFVICSLQLIILAPTSIGAFFFLKATNVRKAVLSAFELFTSSLMLFFVYHNGQQIYNQNDKLRKSLQEIPWVDKPRWLRQTMHIMLTQVNRDIEIKPYGIFSLNYMTYKDLIKFTFSVGNVLYTREKLVNQSQ